MGSRTAASMLILRCALHRKRPRINSNPFSIEKPKIAEPIAADQYHDGLLAFSWENKSKQIKPNNLKLNAF
jgi:hypothetical protein